MDNLSENLKNKIKSEMVVAMRAQNKARVSAIRLLTSEIKQREVDNRIELDDAAVLAVIDKMLTQRRDSFNQYKQANREDLATQEAYEMDVLKEFLPPQLSQLELNDLINKTIKTLGATTIKDMGKVMAEIKPQIQGRADVAEVSKTVKELLS
ncbi:MAG: GatB/YqeY domain-containing protein [Gammaproteobacteria bacterium]|nr:GatB/YqeY domain-containing protein [Gammaproteobacteria bacterium]